MTTPPIDPPLVFKYPFGNNDSWTFNIPTKKMTSHRTLHKKIKNLQNKLNYQKKVKVQTGLIDEWLNS